MNIICDQHFSFTIIAQFIADHRKPNLQSRLPFHTQEPERCCTRMKR